MKEEDVKHDKHFIKFNKNVGKFLSDDKDSDILILKSHLLSEYYINQILILNGTEINSLDKLGYAQKLEMLEKVDSRLAPHELATLKKLNKLRNKVGHELEFNLSESDLDGLGYTFLGKDYIIEKYEFADNEKLLHEILLKIVMAVAVSLSVIAEDYQKAKK